MALGDVIARLSVSLGLNTAAFEKGAKDAERQLGQTEKRVETFGNRVSSVTPKLGMLTKALGALGIGLGIREIGRMADEWSEISSRLTNATGSAEAGANALERLTDVARRSYSPIAQTTETFIQQSTALNALGVSTQTQLDLTEALNNALVVSATRGQRADSVMNAWNKAMAVGKMSTDEYNTVVANSGRLAQALADSLGVNVNQLRGLASQGKITREVMLGLAGQLETLRQEAEDMPATIGDGFTLLKDRLLQMVGSFDQSIGASAGLATAMVMLSDNLDAVAAAAVAVGVSFAAMQMGSMVSATIANVRQLIALEKALGATNAATALWGVSIKGVTGAFRALTAVLLANPFGLVATAIAGVTALLYANRDSQVAVGNQTVRLGDIFRGVWEMVLRVTRVVVTGFSKGWAAALGSISPMLRKVGQAFDQVLSFIGRTVRNYVNHWIGLFAGLGAGIKAALNFENPLAAFMGAQGQDYVGRFANSVRGAVIELANLGKGAREAGEGVEEVESAINLLPAAAEGAGKKVGRALKKGVDEAAKAAQELAALLDRLFPEVARRRQFLSDQDILDRAGLDPDQLREARRRLFEEFGGSGGIGSVDFGERGGPLDEGLKNLERGLERLTRKSKDTATRIAKSFKDMADDTLSALNKMASAIQGGGFLGILEGIIGLGLQLGSIGAFGKKIAGNINRTVPGYANGTNFHPGGLAMVGERGPELVELPRGSRVTPNHQLGGSKVEIVPSAYFDVVVDGRVMRAAPAIADAGAQAGVSRMAFKQTRRL